jgi:hypothetical protein
MAMIQTLAIGLLLGGETGPQGQESLTALNKQW